LWLKHLTGVFKAEYWWTWKTSWNTARTIGQSSFSVAEVTAVVISRRDWIFSQQHVSMMQISRGSVSDLMSVAVVLSCFYLQMKISLHVIVFYGYKLLIFAGHDIRSSSKMW